VTQQPLTQQLLTVQPLMPMEQPPMPEKLAETLAELEARPWAFDFHQALRRIEAAFPHLPRAGQAHSPRLEPVRLGQDPSLAFTPSALSQFRAPRADEKGRLRVAFLGLLGPHGPLPLHVAELAHARERSGDTALVDFLNLFQHRMLLLFHRAWAAGDAAAREDRPQDGAFRRYLSALCGRAYTNSQPAPAEQRARWAFTASFLHPARNPEGLETVLGQYFGCSVRVCCFIPDWLEVPPSLAWRLGSRTAGQLGRSSVVGRRVFQPSQKFRVELGPLSRPDFERLLPGTSAFQELALLLSSYAGPELRWELLLRLDRSERPSLRLGKSSRLGRNTWLEPEQRAANGSPENRSRSSRGRNTEQHVLIQSEVSQS
jgi:type VI secretion system protein ImpH